MTQYVRNNRRDERDLRARGDRRTSADQRDPRASAGSGDYHRGNARYATKARRRSPWRVVFWVAIAVLVVALCVLLYIGYTYWSSQNAYEQIAQENFTAPDDAQDGSQGSELAGFSVDWDALRAVNPDVVGWVYIPDTEVSYPIAHRDGDDSYYLSHTFSGDSAGNFGAEFGCIMLSGENSADFSDEVNVIYGHNMTNGSMFALLAGFADSATFNQHRTIYLLTPEASYKLTTFAANRVLGTDTSIVVPSQSASSLDEYVQARVDASLVEPDPEPILAIEESKVFVFSTCDGADNTYRIVTCAEIEDYMPAEGAAEGEHAEDGQTESE